MYIFPDKNTILSVVSEAVASITGINPTSNDAIYGKAVESGDTETALRLIREDATRRMPNTKVVASDSKPLVVYHGTSKYGFNEFDPSKVDLENFGFHFGTKDAAQMFKKGDNPGVYSVFLNISNPFKCDDIFGNSQDYFEEYAIEELEEVGGPDGAEAMDMAEELRSHSKYLSDIYARDDWGEKLGFDIRKFSRERMKKVVHAFKWLGYDGVTYENDGEDRGSTSWIAFEPSQIKSADITYDDSGTLIPLSKRFDFHNHDIRF